MDNPHEKTLGQALNQYLNNSKLKEKLLEVQITEIWKEISDAVVNKHTREIILKDRKLVIRVDSSVVRQELNFIKSRLIIAINRKLETPFIEEIQVI